METGVTLIFGLTERIGRAFVVRGGHRGTFPRRLSGGDFQLDPWRDSTQREVPEPPRAPPGVMVGVPGGGEVPAITDSPAVTKSSMAINSCCRSVSILAVSTGSF